MTEDLANRRDRGRRDSGRRSADCRGTGRREVQAETAAAGEAPAAAEKPAAKAVANSKKTRAAETKTEAPAEPEPKRRQGKKQQRRSLQQPQWNRSFNENFRWYILHAYSGFERKVRESIESRVQAFGLKERVGRVMIPTEPVTEIVNGKKRTVERVFLPGYVLVEMELDNELWHVLKDTPKVTGFLGTGDKPVALSEEEVSSILFRSETSKDKAADEDQV
jgi:hypothetical protein